MEDDCFIQYKYWRRRQRTSEREVQWISDFSLFWKETVCAFGYNCIECRENLDFDDLYLNETNVKRFNKCTKCYNEKMNCIDCENFMKETTLSDKKN